MTSDATFHIDNKLSANHDEALERVCARFGVDQTKTGAAETLLIRYFTAYHLNIEWYDNRIARCEDDQLKNDTMMRTVGFGALLAIVGASVVAALAHHDAGVTGAQISFAVAGLVAALQLVATGKDYKAQRGAFWKARSALKNRLFAFEDVWQGRVLDSAGQVNGDFRAGLAVEIRAAHDILDQERQDYFDTFKSSGEINTVLQTILPGLAAQAPSVASAQQSRMTSASAPIAEAQKSDRDAEAAVRVAAALVAELGLRGAGAGADDGELRAAQTALARAKAEKVGTEYQLQEAIKASRS